MLFPHALETYKAMVSEGLKCIISGHFIHLSDQHFDEIKPLNVNSNPVSLPYKLSADWRFFNLGVWPHFPSKQSESESCMGVTHPAYFHVEENAATTLCPMPL